MGKLGIVLGCAALLSWLSCGGGASALQEACEKSCERTVACEPEFGSVSACKQQCSKAEEVAAERCLTVAKVDACLSKSSCDDYLACAFASTECTEGQADGGPGNTGGASLQAGAGGGSSVGGQGGGLGGSGGTVSPGGPISIDTFPRAFLAALCGHIFKCCDRDIAEFFGTTPQECVATLRPEFSSDFATVQNSVDAARTAFSAEKAAACVDALAESRCDAASTGAAGWETLCDKVFVGLLPSGARCEEEIECADGACVASASSAVTTCQKPPAGGERCVASCAPGFTCDPFSSRCVVLGKTGDECEFDFDCASDFCDEGFCEAPLSFCEIL